MNLKFEDSNIALVYVQTKLKESYNSDIIVNGDYYNGFNSNYGFAHYIFRYLNTMYPPLGTDSYDSSLPNDTFDNINNRKQPFDIISIANYFACDNKGNKLLFPTGYITDGIIDDVPPFPMIYYRNIYGRYLNMIAKYNDLPLFTMYDSSGNLITPNNKDRIYYLYEWKTEKSICELDDLVMSYLLGRTIGPNSSMEDIYYAQTLLIGENNIAINDRGLWISDSGNLTNLIVSYQSSKINTELTHPLFVTGYLDIYTEAELLRSRGEQNYGIYGL